MSKVNNLNNVNEDRFFDTAVHRFLMDRGVLDRFAVETGYSCFGSVLSHLLHVGVRVARLGNACVCGETAL